MQPKLGAAMAKFLCRCRITKIETGDDEVLDVLTGWECRCFHFHGRHGVSVKGNGWPGWATLVTGNAAAPGAPAPAPGAAENFTASGQVTDPVNGDMFEVTIHCICEK
jgi:hypothetical protein